MYGLRQSALL
jgi:hypothetical protein